MLRLGVVIGAGAATAPAAVGTWFAKPAALGYAALYALLEPLVAGEAAAVCGRQMVLGPAPEFCLQTARPVRLPAPLVGK